MKRLPVLQDTPWRSLEERGGAVADPRVAPLDEIDDGVSRRSFLRLMGASIALGSMAGCRRPAEHIYPYGRAPEQIVPGRPQRYASALAFAGTAFGVVVESHEGRPTKIEGNPLHPDSLGGASAFMQAAVLELYDPDRSRSPGERGQPRTWADALAALQQLGATLGDGAGLAILTEPHRSPALAAQLAELKRRFPAARITRYAPFGRAAAIEGARLAFGRPLEAIHSVSKARVLLTLDSDLLQLEGSAVKHARGFADGRRKPAAEMSRLYSIESTFTVTGANADHRLRAQSRRVYGLALAIARALERPLGTTLPEAGALDPSEQRFVTAVARDLARAGAQALVVAGETQGPEVHALACLMNLALGAVGTTLRFVAPFSTDPEGPAALAELTQAMERGEVKTALLLAANPAHTAPRVLGFERALAKVPTSICLSGWFDDTAAACTWHLPRAHWLESWGDVRAEDGTWSVVQPLIAPLHGGRTELEVLEALLGGKRSAFTIVSDTWRGALGPRFTAGLFRRVLHDGVLADSTLPSEPVSASAATLPVPAASTGLELSFRPDAHVYDGRFANNAWLHELPDPMTKLTWGNVALLSPRTAARFGLADGDVVELAVAGASVRTPIYRAPGQADESVTLTLGYGRRVVGSVGADLGVDTGALRPALAMFASGVGLTRTGDKERLAQTQEHHRMEGRPLVREASLAKFEEEPAFAHEPDAEHPTGANLWRAHPYEGHRWGMVIDLHSCTGCNACMIACQAENNIPVVGKDGVLRSREMHWIRIDRYFTGSEDEPQAVMQPIACQQCENAPCEQVCPVGATTHSPEGLNDMAYNRCIGTRYCANNCPFKVRRFNFFNYNRRGPGAAPACSSTRTSPSARAASWRSARTACSASTDAKIDAHKARPRAPSTTARSSPPASRPARRRRSSSAI